MDGDGIDIGLAIADAVGTAIDIDARVAAHLAADVTEVNLTLLQIALNQTIGAHVHIQVETRHRVLEALHIQRALVQLALGLGGCALEVLDQRHHGAGSVQMHIIVLVLDGDAGDPWGAVQRATGLIGNEQAAVELPVDIPQREVGIPLLGAQIDVTLGMQARLAVAHAVVHAQTVQVQVTHIAVGSEDVVVVADRAVGIGVKVAALVGTGGIHVGIAATQLTARLDVAVMVAIISHAGQIDGCIGPCGATIGKIEAVTARIDATGEVAHVIVRQERIDGEVVEAGVHVIILVTDVIVTVATHRAATCRHSQVAGHPTATFLIDLAAHLHGRELDVFQTQHLVEHAGVTQVHLGIEVGLHAVHVGGIVDGAFALDAAHSRHVGIQRMDVEALFVAAGLGLDFHRLIVRNILEGLTGLGHEFLDLVQVDFAVGVDGGFAVGLTVKHILVHMGIKLDVAALGLQLHVVEVQTVLVLVDSSAGVLDLQTAAFLAREVLDGHLHVLAIILKVLDLGIHILDLDIIRIKRGSRLVGLLARLGILSLAVF